MSISIKRALQHAKRALDSSSPSLDAELLLAHVLKRNRTFLHTWPEQVLTRDQESQFHQLVERRGKGEPVAYILGSQEFWSLKLEVTPDTLIPRPETELLVEKALEILSGRTNPLVVDLGTGSGAIALAIATERPDALVIAVDLFAPVLAVAKSNAKSLKLTNIGFVQSSWLDCFSPGIFDIVVSNPPYIVEGDPNLAADVKRYEPLNALYAAKDGLADIEKITELSQDALSQNGWLLLEHGWAQSIPVQTLLGRRAFSHIETIKDLAGHDRVTCAKLSGK